MALQKGRPDQALAEFREAVRLAPGLMPPTTTWAGAEAARLREAVAHYRRALEIDWARQAHNSLGGVSGRGAHRRGGRRFPQALREARRRRAHNNLGLALRSMGEATRPSPSGALSLRLVWPAP